MEKSADAFRTISEVAEDLVLPQHVLRFWETRFPQIRPLKRAGGRRYYRPTDVILLRTIRQLLYENGYTIKGVQRLLKEQGARALGPEPRPMEVRDGAPDEAFERDIDAERAWRAPEEDAQVGEDTAEASAIPTVTIDEASVASRALVADALATIEECKRILDVVLPLPPLHRD